MKNSSKPLWIDTHAHIDKLSLSLEEALELAKKAGVFRILTIGTELSDWREAVSLCERGAPEIYGALGMHPHNAKDFNEECESFLRANLSRQRIVAVGEIGLDYYYENSDRKKQKEVFERQLALACQLKMPVEIHTRAAEEDTAFFLRRFKGRLRGLLHCFTGSYSLAKQALDCGFNISFSGILTFKKAESLRELCAKIPLDRLHIETDSPFLSPEPYRGKENQPAYLPQVAERLARRHKIDLPALSERLRQNTLDLFPKINREELLI